jgi:hypothetical protein
MEDFCKIMKKIVPQALQVTLQKQWAQLTQCRKAFAITQRGYLEREQLWPDQVRLWLEQISEVRKPLARISAQLTNSERLPLGLAARRYPVLESIHHYDGQLDAMHRLLFPHRIRQPAGAEVIRELEQQLEAQARTWSTLRRRYIAWCAVLNQTGTSQS